MVRRTQSAGGRSKRSSRRPSSSPSTGPTQDASTTGRCPSTTRQPVTGLPTRPPRRGGTARSRGNLFTSARASRLATSFCYRWVAFPGARFPGSVGSSEQRGFLATVGVRIARTLSRMLALPWLRTAIWMKKGFPSSGMMCSSPTGVSSRGPSRMKSKIRPQGSYRLSTSWTPTTLTNSTPLWSSLLGHALLGC